MRKKTPVLALSTVLASFLLIAAQHPADAACAGGSSPECDSLGQSNVKLAQADERRGPEDYRRRGPEDFRARDHDLPSDLWDRIKMLPPLPPGVLEDLIKRLEDVAHKISDAEAHAAEAQKRIRDDDDQIDKLRTDKITAEGEKHAAELERERQQGRLVALLHDSLHDIKPPPPPRPPEDWRARRWFRPRPVFHHFCPPLLYPPPFPPLFAPPLPPPEVEYGPPRERVFFAPPPREPEFYPPPRREFEVREVRPPCCGCERRF
jgi:hypothetical protein